jgi:murein DD-endopeptidase MepM/ murein hydrolase activator NlpD
MRHFLAGLLCLTLLARADAAAAQGDVPWRTYTNAAASYAFEHPADAAVQESSDAALAYPIVYAQFPVTDTLGYQGASIMVYEDQAGTGARGLLAREYQAQNLRPPQVASTLIIGAREARESITLTRDAIIGDLDARTVLISGNGVVYRINLFGGGKSGDVPPSPQAERIFERLLRSFTVLKQPLRPKVVIPSITRAQTAAVASAFSFPMRNANGVQYGVPVGIVINGTRMEWLDYAIRNLDQWRVKCYGVDWSRMLHTGEDWYRFDYLTRNTAGSPVYAVADGVVARHSPGLSYPGNVVVIRHRLPDGRDIYSMYGHVANVSVVVGQAVGRGQQIATVFNQGYVGRTPGRHPSWDSHLHFEMRWMADAGRIYTRGANAYGYNYPGCNWLYPGRGYTYRISPNDYPYPNAGYVDPSDFIRARLPATAQASDDGLLGPGAQTSSFLPAVGSAASPLGTPTQQARCSNIAVNGEFETSSGWAGIANTAGAIYTEAIYSAARARNGSRSGRVGSPAVNGYWNEILQTMTIPPNASSATLTVWRYLETGETSRTRAYDIFTIGLETDKGIELVAPRRVDNTSAGRNVWVREALTLPNPGALANQGVWITIKGNTDRNKPTKLYIDDVALTVCTK